MKALLLALLVVAAVLLVGCSLETIYLQHPDTKEVKSCDGSTYLSLVGRDTGAYLQRGCVADFQRQGYERMKGKP
jgi:hypothetical protein